MSDYELKDNIDRDQWDQFLRDSDNGTVFNRSEILTQIALDRKGELRLLGIFNNNNLIAGLPLIIMKKAFCKIAVSVPSTFVRYGGVIYRFPESRSIKRKENHIRNIAESLLKYFKQNKFMYILMKMNNSVDDLRPYISGGFKCELNYTYYSPISDIDNMWDNLDNEVRKNIKKCEKGGGKLFVNGNILELHRLVKDTYRRKGHEHNESSETLVKLYDLVLKNNCGKLFLLKNSDGETIAGRAMVWDDKRAYDWFAGSDEKYIKLGVNSFLAWECLKEANIQGKNEFDWCGANVGKVSRFKAAFNPVLIHGFILRKNNLFPFWPA